MDWIDALFFIFWFIACSAGLPLYWWLSRKAP